MAFVSVTRLRIRSWRFMPGFVVDTKRSLSQTRDAVGFLHGSLLADRKRTFWTLTVWADQADMRAFMTSGAHRQAMPKLLEWCDEASLVHWTQGDDAVPSWNAASDRMRTEGRPSKVRHPSPRHGDLSYAEPWTRGALPIRRRTDAASA